MMKSNRLGSTLAAVSVIAMVTACAGPGTPTARSASIFGGDIDKSNIGLATRAQLALEANDVQKAIGLAERAVENTPRDAGFRALLGNCYLAAGRFQSAEMAYKDSLSLLAHQPRVILKLALVQISLGKNDQALSLLQEGQSIVDHGDLGLAVALAGNPQGAVQVLEPLARQAGADARTRQNLALAYALSGNWEQAKIVAAQDLPANEVDARIQQWAAIAKPGSQVEQVASFIGFRPTAGDVGQPVRLALNKEDAKVRMAQAAAPVVPAPQPEPVVEVAASEFSDAPAQPVQPVVAAVAAVAEPVAVPTVIEDNGSSVTIALPPMPPMPKPAARSRKAPGALRTASVATATPAPAMVQASVHTRQTVAALRRAALVRAGSSEVVVQLGAYSNKTAVHHAWRKLSPQVGNYTPVSARFEGAKGTFYRLAVKGFDNSGEARALCATLKRQGKACFVRSTAGDVPVRIASR